MHHDLINFSAKSSKLSLCDYSDAYVLVTGNIAVAGADDNTKFVFKTCASFRKCRAEINEAFIDEAAHNNIAIPMKNVIEYSGNCYDSSEGLWQSKRLKETK